jgi:hypothetical protein
VLLATSILLASFIVLGQLAGVGRRHAEDVQDLTAAQLACQSKLNEIISGAVPLAAVENAPVDESPGLVYSVDVEYGDSLDLLTVRVTVTGQSGPDDDPGRAPRKSFTLTRWMHRAGFEGESSAAINSVEAEVPLFDFDEGVQP